MAGGVVLVLEAVGIAAGATAVVLAQCAPDELRGAWSRQAWSRRPVVAALMGWDDPAERAVNRGGGLPAHARRPHPHRIVSGGRERRLPPHPGDRPAAPHASGLQTLMRDDSAEPVPHDR